MTPAKKEFSETMVARMVVKAAHPDRSRAIENTALLVGVACVALYALSDFLIRVGLVRPAVCPTGIPWTLIILVGCLVMPKMLGRATTGRLWSAAINRVGGKES